MIDHISIAVRDLAQSAAFYESVFSKLGFTKLVEKPGTVGFGKRYPEFWLNHRPEVHGHGGVLPRSTPSAYSQRAPPVTNDKRGAMAAAVTATHLRRRK